MINYSNLQKSEELRVGPVILHNCISFLVCIFFVLFIPRAFYQQTMGIVVFVKCTLQVPIWFLYVDFVLKLIIQFLHVSFGQKLNCHQTYKQATFIITKLTLTFFLTSWNVQENNKRKKRKAENNLWEYFLKGNLAQLVKTDLHLALLYIYPGLCGRKKCVPDF